MSATEQSPIDGGLIVLPRAASGNGFSIPADVLGQAPSSDTLARWFESLGTLQRCASGSRDFFADAAAAVCDPGGLDVGYVISLIDNGTRADGLSERRARKWQVDASSGTEDSHHDIRPDIVSHVCRLGRTVYHDANACDPNVTEFVIASPVFDRNNAIIGLVYGIRSMTDGTNKRRGVRPLEAIWVQLVAESVTAASVRSELEADLVRSRVMFESAFAPQIVQQLIQDPSALTARKRELTILFADLRDFTRTAETLGPEETYRMLSDVMNRFTDQVMLHGGVIIDYYGDGMAAMWNAPTDQIDHPLMACSAALGIREQLSAINDEWSGQLGQPLRIGIGLHTGVSIVGNAGSDRHLKYGPRGPAVNLTSRIETATKRLGVTIAMTADVEQRVQQQMATRRLCKARLAGVDQPVEIFELVDRCESDLNRDVAERLWRYEEALNAFENSDYDLAERILSQTFTRDGPSQLLMNVIEKSKQKRSLDTVWNLENVR